MQDNISIFKLKGIIVIEPRCVNYVNILIKFVINQFPTASRNLLITLISIYTY